MPGDGQIPHRDVVAIGGSLGAVDAVRVVLSALPADLPAAVLIALHTGREGGRFLSDIFAEAGPLPVEAATEGNPLRRGHIYVAAPDRHLLVVDGRLRLGAGPRENFARPAIDPLLRSVGVDAGPRAVGVVLTGLLNDGASGLADLKRCGGVTVVQNPADAVAADMPLGALRATDVDYRAPLSDIGLLIARLTREPAPPPLAIPDSVRLEVDIALGRQVTSRNVAHLGDAVPLTCPDCGGVLSQMRQSGPLRFRCQVGHGFTGESLERENEFAVDEAMRVALRIIEERILLAEKLGDEARRSGRPSAAEANHRRARELRVHAEPLRRAIADSRANGMEVPGDASRKGRFS